MTQIEVFILKFVSVNRLATSAIMVGKVTTLAHETGDDTVENAAFISKSFLTSAQSAKVLSCLWHDIRTQLQTADQ